MKCFSFFMVLVLTGVPAVWAGEKNPAQTEPLFTWGLLWNGSWVENKNLMNRGEIRFGFPVPGLLLRGQAIDKRPMDFSSAPPWGDGSTAITGFSGGLYHKPTGSRLLYGVLDEWGLSARIRNPWLRSAPFAENHQPLITDLKTSAPAAEPKVSMYLSSPWLPVFPKTALRGFAAAQTPGAKFAPDVSGGIEAKLGVQTRALLEAVYAGSEIPARKSASWFDHKPPLPERKLRFYALGVLAASPFWSVSSDWAYSETFAVGRDIYGNLGIRINPPFPLTEKKPGPWSLSLAADGAGSRFTGRDGSSPGAGFRAAGKLEWKGKRASLLRFGTVVRGPGLGERLARSSSAVYYRFPGPVQKINAEEKTFPLRISRVSLGVDRNAVDWAKISDSIDGSLGLSLSLLPLNIKSPLGINFTGSLKGLCSAEEIPSPYPLPKYPYRAGSAKVSGEFSWAPAIFQFRTRWGYELSSKKEDRWNMSFSAAVRHQFGRFSVKVASPDFPDKWNCTLSWHVEKK